MAKNPNNLSFAEKEKLGLFKGMNLKTYAYNFKLSLKDFWTFNDTLLAEDYLRNGISGLPIAEEHLSSMLQKP